MALYKKIPETPSTQEITPQPVKKRKNIKRKVVDILQTVYEHPQMNEKQRMYSQMFPDRQLAYCMQ